MKSQSKKTDINPRSYTEPWRFLIQTYLRNALCPVPSSRGVHLRDRLKEGFLVSHNGDRRFDCMQKGVKVLELDIWDFRTMVRRYIDDAPDCFITESDKPDMNIPCYGVNSLNMGQVNFLSRVDGQDEFLLLIMTFVLGPVTHCCRILNNIPRYVPMAQSLEFIASRGPDQKAAVEWDVLRIPATTYGEGSLSIICVPPWKLDLKDLRAFTMPENIPQNVARHPRFQEISEAARNTAHDLWQVVLESCAPAGPCFVVTNYAFWCFGRFEAAKPRNSKGKEREGNDEGWATATVSPPIELEMSIPNSVRLPMKTEPMGLGCTVTECLTFWIQMTRGAASWMQT
ncbi:uncharacterized protein C8R40DRAFT_1086927 [Lentinula edodes]|uniref:uncharacterized protein n=1 Tax=Lentinula edodes TaxID=5353 RepID=UPI001E8EB32B|nr:uncharacterized protein C8R40DRAFT_1086927 [Lentinula edodes]KAH7878787.1 hypothetical protein C8R40DRAFT_1086927 [Lentinula edodes]